ncbi:MAG TPA: LppX_LprAFG lipoprotein [Candidatus Dormibacteraeota bacterium]
MRRTLAAVLAIGLLSACAGVNAPAASKSDTPQQSLAATGKEMAKLKSVRFDAKGTVSLTLPASLVDQLRAKAGPQGSFLSSNMIVDLTISGAVKTPDQLQATIEAKLGGLTVDTEVIAAGGRLYAKDPMTGKWNALGQSDKANSTKSKAGLSYQALIDTAKSLTEISDQPSTINGVAVDHYRIVPDLVKLLAQVSTGGSSKDPQLMAALQGTLQNAQLTADVWTGASDHLIRRVSYDADVTADLHALAAAFANGTRSNGKSLQIPAGSMAHLTAHAVINLHDFNGAVTITAPTVSS